MVSRSIYNLKIDTIYMYDIPFDRLFLQLSSGIRHVMPSTDPKPELTAKASMAQPVSQPAVYANGLKSKFTVKSLKPQHNITANERSSLPIISASEDLQLVQLLTID
jgi:hypothetical protein